MNAALKQTFNAITTHDVAESRALLDQLENRLLDLPQVTDDDMQLKEWVSGGLYCRQITIPKGVMLTGRFYKFDHMEIMLSGDITIKSANGISRRYKGHNVIQAQSGKRQAGYAHKETVWMTVNRVPDIPLERMLDYTTCLDYAHYCDFHRRVNQHDYQLFLIELGISQAQMDTMVQVDDVCQSDACSHLYLDGSSLDGFGLFSDIAYSKGDVIAPSRDGEFRTVAGRYTNHALHANAEAVEDGIMFQLRAVRDIPAGEEITLNYRQVMKLRESRGELCQVQ